MARGSTAEVGATRVAKNGYHYTKTTDRGWVLTHWLTIEKVLGRQIDPATDQVRFRSKEAKNNPYDEKGIEVIKKRTSSKRKRLAQIESRLQELEAEASSLRAQLNES